MSSDVIAWAGSGAMALTGEPDGPPRPEPAAAAAAAAASAEALAAATACWGRRVCVDGPAILGERAAIAGLTRQGSVSPGGSAFFVRAADGWVVLNLPRTSDTAALPALVGTDIDPSEWPEVARRLAAMPTATILERAALLSLAAAAPPGRADRSRTTAGDTLAGTSTDGLTASDTSASGSSPAGRTPDAGECAAGVPGQVGEQTADATSVDGSAVVGVRRHVVQGAPRSRTGRPRVIDLSALWAGPLAGGLLAEAGAEMIKVEGHNRPDGARRGPRAFFDLLNARKRCVALDFECNQGRALLLALMRSADLVLEGSRPRVMDRLGIRPEELARSGTSWLSITGYGRSGPAAERIAFGDDAAVAAGLFVAGGVPLFAADALADPLAGLQAAAVASEMLAELLAGKPASVAEVSLIGAARRAVGRVAANKVIRDGQAWAVLVDGERVPVAEPRARPTAGAAVAHGAHTAELIAELAENSQQPRGSA